MMILNTVDMLIVHCSATPPKRDIGVKEIRRWHLARGFLDVGYHFVIRRDGTIEEGRSIHAPGAHAIGYNNRSLGICLVGGTTPKSKPSNNFTPDQWESLGSLLSVLSEKYPHAEVLGHRDLPNVAKDCPCFDVKEWWQGPVAINWDSIQHLQELQ